MPVLSTAVLLYQIIFYLNSSFSFFVTDSMSDENLSNNLNVRIEVIIQHVLSKLDFWFWQQNATSAAEAHIRFKQFKLTEIEFFNSEQNVENDKLWIQNVFIFIQRIKNVMIIQENEIVQSNLFSCLQEIITIWYHNMIINIDYCDNEDIDLKIKSRSFYDCKKHDKKSKIVWK